MIAGLASSWAGPGAAAAISVAALAAAAEGANATTGELPVVPPVAALGSSTTAEAPEP